MRACRAARDSPSGNRLRAVIDATSACADYSIGARAGSITVRRPFDVINQPTLRVSPSAISMSAVSAIEQRLPRPRRSGAAAARAASAPRRPGCACGCPAFTSSSDSTCADNSARAAATDRRGLPRIHQASEPRRLHFEIGFQAALPRDQREADVIARGHGRPAVGQRFEQAPGPRPFLHGERRLIVTRVRRP